jgi:hypothetical protein
MNGWEEKAWNVEEGLMDSSPRQRDDTQRTVCQEVSGEAKDPRVGTSTLLTWRSPCDFFISKDQSALKGTRYRNESVDAVKAKATKVMKKLSEKGLQHCFQQWKIRMELCRGRGGDHFEGDNIPIVWLVQ